MGVKLSLGIASKMKFYHIQLFVAVLIAVLSLKTCHGFRYSSIMAAPAPRSHITSVSYSALPQPHRRSFSAGPTTRSRFLQGRPLMATIDDVQDVISSQLGVDKEKVVSAANFVSDLGADSLDSVELIMALEEKFGVTIPDEDATKLKTVQDAIEYIDKAKAGKA